MSWSLNRQYVEQLLPTLKQTNPEGEFRIQYDRYCPGFGDLDMHQLGEWLHQKSFELYSIGFQPPDDLMVIAGRDMQRILFRTPQRVVRHGHIEYDYNLPARIVLPKLSATLPQAAGTPLDRANSITLLYLPWIKGWCFCTIPECAPNQLQLTNEATSQTEKADTAQRSGPTIDVQSEPADGHVDSKRRRTLGRPEQGKIHRLDRPRP